jgi:arylsulfatase A-like enzyme
MISRRTFLRRSLGSIAVLAGFERVYASEKPDLPKHPNILLIFIDDMGYADPSCFGNPKVRTPNIDRLAQEGIRLTNFYSNSPICSPSRVAVMTGQYPAQWDIHSYLNSRKRNRERGMANYLDPRAPTTARLLKKAGYATAHFGKWHIGGGRDVDDAPLPQAYGFDESLVSFEGLGDRILFPNDGLCDQSAKLGHGTITRVPKHQSTETYVDRAIDFMNRNREKPFYIELFPNDVHDAHLPKPGTAEKFETITDNPFERSFFAVLEELDRQLGRVIDAIDDLGQESNTLVVFTSDNGPTDWPHYYKKGYQPPGFTGPLYGRKWSLYEGGIRMPFIARWKGVIPAGRTNDETVMCGVDLSPSFCRLAGVETDPTSPPDGEVMIEALLGNNVARKEPAFWHYGKPYAQLRPGNPDFVSPSLAVRDAKWKLLINPDGSDAQLYNLAEDIGETRNLVVDFPEKAAELWQKLRAWAARVDIPVEDKPLA